MEQKAPAKITLLGWDDWSSAIATIIGRNAGKYRNDFNSEVRFWVHEEMGNVGELIEIINTQHENAKYLPGRKLPSNVVAVGDLVAACTESDIIIFAMPHQLVENVCIQLKGHLKKGVLAISLIKGFLANRTEGVISLISEGIQKLLNIDTAVLMGANIAEEVANEEFSEATIGCKGQKDKWSMLKKLFESDHFRISLTEDSDTVELCGVLKNIVACAAGFADGLGYGNSTKATIIRLGLLEIIAFVKLFYHGSHIRTYFESCGVADLVATCTSGRNRKICEAFIKSKKPIQELEQEILEGQRILGPVTAEAVFMMLKKQNILSRFPLFVAVHQIFQQQLSPNLLIACLRKCQNKLPDN